MSWPFSRAVVESVWIEVSINDREIHLYADPSTLGMNASGFHKWETQENPYKFIPSILPPISWTYSISEFSKPMVHLHYQFEMVGQ